MLLRLETALLICLRALCHCFSGSGRVQKVLLEAEMLSLVVLLHLQMISQVFDMTLKLGKPGAVSFTWVFRVQDVSIIHTFS